MSTIADTLREEMKKQRYSGRALCQACGVEQATLSRFLTGKGGMTLKTANALLGVLGLELAVQKKQRGA